MSKPPRSRPGQSSTLVANVEPVAVQGGAPAETAQPRPAQSEEQAPAEKRAHGDVPVEQQAPHDTHQGAEEAGTSKGAKSARERLEASAMKARLQANEWDSYTVRLPEPLWARLQERVEADQKAYGRSVVGMSHYLNAAFEAIPAPTKAAKLAVAHQEAAGLVPPASRSSGTRLHADVRRKLDLLPAQLRRAARPGLLGHLQAALLAQFLDELDEIDK